MHGFEWDLWDAWDVWDVWDAWDADLAIPPLNLSV
jgi:hypothetical protein